jgi:LysR family glycine cleavage system transcriptional activator
VTLPESFAETLVHEGASRISIGRNSAVDLRLNASNRRSRPGERRVRFRDPLQPAAGDRPGWDRSLRRLRSSGLHTGTFSDRFRGFPVTMKSLEGIPLVHLENRTPDPQWAGWQDWCARFDIEAGANPAASAIRKSVPVCRPRLPATGLVLCGITEAYDSIAERASRHAVR